MGRTRLGGVVAGGRGGGHAGAPARLRAYREAGDPGCAARVAAWLAADFREFREEAVGRGWLGAPGASSRRSPRPPTTVGRADRGRLRAERRRRSRARGRAAANAAGLGRALGVPDLEAMGLAVEGGALVLHGRVDEGMRRLDEASAIAAGEDLQLPATTAWSFCCLVFACDGVGDFPRAAQWCNVMRPSPSAGAGARSSASVAAPTDACSRPAATGPRPRPS